MALARLQFGNRIHALDQRQVVQLDEILAPDDALDPLYAFLTQPAQTPVALHSPLKFGVGVVGQLEIAQGGEQGIRFGMEVRRRAIQAGDQLPLVEQIDIAAQR